jgi:tRNA (guanine37-N1)-methyltransferase
LQQKRELIAKAIIDTHNGVKSVWQQVSSVTGDFRLRDLDFILGKKTSETIYKEHNCSYKTDLKETYFSPRLSYERLRIAELVQPGETVLNMFAGVGCYSIAIANHSKPLKVYSIDINPIAFKYLQENIRLNRREEIVIPLLGDAKKIIEKGLQNIFDRVIMPLPEKAFEYLDSAILALKPHGGWINYYDFEYAKKNEDPIEKSIKKVSKKIKVIRNFEIKFGRIVRSIGPGWYQIVLDICVKD